MCGFFLVLLITIAMLSHVMLFTLRHLLQNLDRVVCLVSPWRHAEEQTAGLFFWPTKDRSTFDNHPMLLASLEIIYNNKREEN